MSITKEIIIEKIRLLAAEDDGRPPGQGKFAAATNISMGSWRGRYWANWSDALTEAGFAPNQPHERLERAFLLSSNASLTRKIGRFPTSAEVRMERQTDQSFPGHMPIQKLGTRAQRIELVRQFATENLEFNDVLELLPSAEMANPGKVPAEIASDLKIGYVYLALLKIGSEKRYKIG